MQQQGFDLTTITVKKKGGKMGSIVSSANMTSGRFPTAVLPLVRFQSEVEMNSCTPDLPHFA